MSAPNLLLRKVNSVWKGGWNVGRTENGRNKRNKRNKTEAAGVFGILPDTAVSGNSEKDLRGELHGDGNADRADSGKRIEHMDSAR